MIYNRNETELVITNSGWNQSKQCSQIGILSHDIKNKTVDYKKAVTTVKAVALLKYTKLGKIIID